MAVGEMARRRQRAGTGEQKLDAVLHGRGLWEQPQRPTEPPSSAFGREPCCRLAGLAQDRNGTEVALARGALDVVGARRHGRTSCGERLGAPLVRSQPPACRGGLVDRTSHQRVPEAEPPRHIRLADEIELQELVDGVHRRVLGRPRRGRGQLGLERVARHRRAFEHRARRLGQQRELLGQRSGDGGRDTDGQRQLGSAGTAAGCEVERTARAAGDRTGCRRSPRRAPPPRRRRRASPRRHAPRRDSALRARSGSARPSRCARSSAADRRSGVWRGRIPKSHQHG